MTSLLDKYREETVDKPEKIPQEQKKSNSLLDKYRETPSIEKDETYQKYFKAPEYSRDEYKNLSLREKMEYNEDLKRDREYRQSKGVTKGVISGVTLGASEHIPGLKPQEHELGSEFGKMLGEALPITGALKVASLPLKYIPTAFKKLSSLARIGTSGVVGSATEATKQALTPDKEFDPYDIALSGAAFSGLHALFEGIPAAYRWFKGLNGRQQSEMLVNGTIPENLTKDQWSFYSEEVMPALDNLAKSEYETALKEATESQNMQYQQKLSNAKADHEQDLYKLAQEQKLSDMDAMKAQEQYQNKLNQIAAEHQMEMQAIEKSNAEALKEYQIKQQEFQNVKRREDLVYSAINRPVSEESASLSGRVSPRSEDLRIEIEPMNPASQTLKDEVGSIISPERITNKTEAARNNFEAVRASDKADYANVNRLYNQSEQLNQTVQDIHPQLVNQLENTIREIDAIPEPSAPQKQIRTVAEKTKQRLVAMDADGNITGYRPVSNQILLEQAKALRYALDFDFAHGNPKNIFKPTINSLQNAAENAAINVGNQEAYEANQMARNAYREWTDTYQNDFIRKYRDVSNHEFIKTFDQSLNIDDFARLNDVLSKSPSGQQLAEQTRRELINKYLDKFYKNPKSFATEEFTEVLNELSPILREGEAYEIRQSFIQSQKTKPIQGKLIEFESPKEPKLKQTPQSVKIPLKKQTVKSPKEVTEVKVPIKGEIKPTPEMKAASKKMGRQVEDVMKMTDNPTGLRNLKKELSGSEPAEKLFNKIAQQKVREILYKGKVQPRYTGKELFDTINEGNNYSLLSEILGEEATDDLLMASRKLSDKRLTKELIKNLIKKSAALKSLALFGII